jgi:hypothetical protein
MFFVPQNFGGQARRLEGYERFATTKQSITYCATNSKFLSKIKVSRATDRRKWGFSPYGRSTGFASHFVPRQARNSLRHAQPLRILHTK